MLYLKNAFYFKKNKQCQTQTLCLYLEPKCICKNELSYQSKTGENETVVGNEILCVEDGYLQHSGRCNDDEYCMGTTNLHEAECGTDKLCKKGYN